MAVKSIACRHISPSLASSPINQGEKPMSAPLQVHAPAINYLAERIDLAVAFRSAAKLNLHEAVANHFSLAVDDTGKRFLMNPNQRHFSTISASDMLLLDADDKDVMKREGAPDPTAWGTPDA